VSIQHGRVGRMDTEPTYKVSIQHGRVGTTDAEPFAPVSIQHGRVGLRGLIGWPSQRAMRKCPFNMAASASAAFTGESVRAILAGVHSTWPRRPPRQSVCSFAVQIH